MGRPCGCGGGQQLNRLGRPARTASTTPLDPTTALFAAAKVTYEVLPHAGGTGKRFSTLAAAQDYARRTRGVIRTL